MADERIHTAKPQQPDSHLIRDPVSSETDNGFVFYFSFLLLFVNYDLITLWFCCVSGLNDEIVNGGGVVRVIGYVCQNKMNPMSETAMQRYIELMSKLFNMKMSENYMRMAIEGVVRGAVNQQSSGRSSEAVGSYSKIFNHIDPLNPILEVNGSSYRGSYAEITLLYGAYIPQLHAQFAETHNPEWIELSRAIFQMYGQAINDALRAKGEQPIDLEQGWNIILEMYGISPAEK